MWIIARDSGISPASVPKSFAVFRGPKHLRARRILGGKHRSAPRHPEHLQTGHEQHRRAGLSVRLNTTFSSD